MTQEIWHIYTTVATIVNFALLVALLYWLHKRAGSPMTRYLDQRRASVAQSYEEAERARAEASRAAEEARQRLATIDSEIARMRELAQEQIQATHDEMLGKARLEAERVRQHAENYVDCRAEEILRDLRQRASESIVRLAEQRIGPDARDRLHDALFNELVASLAEQTAETVRKP